MIRVNEALIILAIHRGLMPPCFSAEMLEEYAEVLAQPKFGFPLDEIDALIELLQMRGLRMTASPSLDVTSPDPDDQMFLACAQAAGVDFIVTGNKRHFPSPGEGILVVSAGELLDRITMDL
jgi:uncharacterized protein